MAAKRKKKSNESVIPKDALAKVVQNLIKESGLTQTEVGARVKDAPSQVSLVWTGKLTGISPDRLVRMILGLGRDVEIRITKTKGTGKVRVVER